MLNLSSLYVLIGTISGIKLEGPDHRHQDVKYATAMFKRETPSDKRRRLKREARFSPDQGASK